MIPNTTDDKIWVNISRTVNLGDYNSVKIELGVSQTVNSSVELSDQISTLSDEVFDIILEKSSEYKRAIKPKTVKR